MEFSGEKRPGNEMDESHIEAKKIKEEDKHSLINKTIFAANFKSFFKEAFRDGQDYSKGESVELHSYPFKHCIIHNFLEEESFLQNLQNELLELQFHEKSNDLYQFHQSNDLKTSTKESISQFRRLLYEDCLDWIRTVTDIPLDGRTIDMSCAKYTNTDVLLCHDDELEGRRIAYIFYLVPEWSENDGGTLDLFTTDEFGQPDKIVKSLVPKWNSLVFFEVTPVSFHQVSEVLSHKTRLSISGWFHGTPIVRPSPYRELAPARHSPIQLEDEVLIAWVNPIYLQSDVAYNIRESFEESSDIELQDFLLKEKYEMLLRALDEGEVSWRFCGPANKRRCKKAEPNSLSGVAKECLQFFKSEPMFRLLTTLTGLKLSDVDIFERHPQDLEDNEGGQQQTAPENVSPTPEEEEENRGETYNCHGDVYRWSHGCYTLIHDNDPDSSEMSLDFVFYIGCDGWREDFGGYTSYIARGDDEELLTIYPSSNSLALVYRDTETLRFIKHINCRSRAAQREQKPGTTTNSSTGHYYTLMLSYFE